MNISTLQRIATGLISEQSQSGDPEGKLRAEGIAYLYNFIVRELIAQGELRQEQVGQSESETRPPSR
jgi:hypothetical protein